jgi:hypothetical protein
MQGDQGEQRYCVMQHLVDARLLMLSEGEVSISHEGFLHWWPRLRQWIEESRESLLVRNDANLDAIARSGADQDNSYLHAGHRQVHSAALSRERSLIQPVIVPAISFVLNVVLLVLVVVLLLRQVR